MPSFGPPCKIDLSEDKEKADLVPDIDEDSLSNLSLANNDVDEATVVLVQELNTSRKGNDSFSDPMQRIGLYRKHPRYVHQIFPPSFPAVPPTISVSTSSPPDKEQAIPPLPNNTSNDDEDNNEENKM